MNTRVALLIPYFGKLPEWLPYYVESVSTLTHMDVHLFTDAILPHTLPSNLYIHAFRLEDFCHLATQKTGVPVEFSHPYKCCDLKPAYGHIFEDLIREYSHWGYGDLDVVYGNIDAVIERYCSTHDIVSFRKGWLSGSLCFFKNSASVNSLYRQSSDWKSVFTNPQSFLFDEMGGQFYQEVISGTDPLSLQGTVVSFTHVVKSLEKNGVLSCAFQDLACEQLSWKETLQYNSGNIKDINSGEEIPYIHWVLMKRRFFHIPTAQNPKTFFIRKTGIYLRKPGIWEVLLEEPRRVFQGLTEMVNRKLFSSVHFPTPEARTYFKQRLHEAD